MISEKEKALRRAWSELEELVEEVNREIKKELRLQNPRSIRSSKLVSLLKKKNRIKPLKGGRTIAVNPLCDFLTCVK